MLKKFNSRGGSVTLLQWQLGSCGGKGPPGDGREVRPAEEGEPVTLGVGE